MTLRSISGALAALVLLAGPALAQRTPLYQDGTATPNHIAKFNAQGRATDAGGVAGDALGRGVAPFAVTDGKNLGLCFNSDKTSAQYNALCLGHDTEGNAQLTIDSYGGLDAKTMSVKLNGVSYPFPFTASSSVVAPSSTTIGMLPNYNNTTGTLLGIPGTAALDAQGLNVAKGRAPEQNGTSYAAQFVYHGDTDVANRASAAAYVRNEYTGSNTISNPDGFYGTLWYQGTGANVATAVKGNFYTYDSSQTLNGTLPNQYFDAPNIGTLPIAAGVYGRVAHYLPGTINFAASVYADGIYNISTPVGGAVTNFANFLASPPYAPNATHNYFALQTGNVCSPSCYEATLATTTDPLILKTYGSLDIAMKPGGRVSIMNSPTSAVTGSANTSGIYTYMDASAQAYFDAVSQGASASNWHFRTYAGSGLYEEMQYDSAGALRLYAGTRTIPQAGSSNAAGLWMYQNINGASYLDSLTAGSNTTELHFRTYAGSSVYRDMYLDNGGRLFMAGPVAHKATPFASLDSCNPTRAGYAAYVNDSAVNTWGVPVAGGGSTPVLAFCNGTAWTVAAK